MRHCSFTFAVPNRNLTVCYLSLVKRIKLVPRISNSVLLYVYLVHSADNYELLFITFATHLFAPDAIVLLKQRITWARKVNGINGGKNLRGRPPIATNCKA